jgi:hypothetical protein
MMLNFRLHPMFVQHHVWRLLHRSISSLSLSPNVRELKMSNITTLQTRRKHTFQPPLQSGLYTPNTPADPDPSNYIRGHWLHRDALKHGARYIQFDLDALCSKVIWHYPGARFITSYFKIEGGYNRVFIFRIAIAQRIVARLPSSVIILARLCTGSEVATINYRTY